MAMVMGTIGYTHGVSAVRNPAVRANSRAAAAPRWEASANEVASEAIIDRQYTKRQPGRPGGRRAPAPPPLSPAHTRRSPAARPEPSVGHVGALVPEEIRSLESLRWSDRRATPLGMGRRSGVR